MTSNEFNKVVKEQLEICENTLCRKAAEYDRDSDDRFHSFKVAGELQGESAMKALGGMMCKHTVSVFDLIKDNDPNVDLWTEKITDSINYLLLLKGLVIEQAAAKAETQVAEPAKKTKK